MKSPGGKRSQSRGAPPSVSEIIPTIRMLETHEWIRKGSVIPISMTLVAVFVMEFAALQDPPWYEIYALMVVCFMAVESVHTIYKLCGIRKPYWWLAIMAAVTFIICRFIATDCNIYAAFSKYTNYIPAMLQLGPQTSSFFDQWAKYFFSAAMPEEIIKITPVIIALVLGRFLQSPWRERLGVREPLDGVLLGSTSAMGFSASETAYRYFLSLNCMTNPGHFQLAHDKVALLIFPRALGEVAGHAAYTGFLGYAIGLAIVRPSRRWFTLLSGFVIATLAHSLYDATVELSGFYSILSLFVAIACYALLAAAILKAREISPTRAYNFATNFMRGLPGDSAFPAPSAFSDSGSNQTPEAKPLAEGKSSSETTAPQQSTPQAAPVSVGPVKTVPLAFTLYVAGKVILLTHGFKIKAGDIPGLSASAEDGVLAEVVSSPKHPGEFGLRNCSTATWKIRLPGGVEGEVPSEKAIRLARGIVFTFGDARGEIL
jgi:RsiW-degrading membrane proteinase PrsW (M82 family)